QRHVFALTCLHQFAILTENVTERDMAEIDFVTFASRDLEDLFEMQRLRCADHIPERVALQFIDSILDRRDIAGRVIESAVTLTDYARLVCMFRTVSADDNRRSFAALSN